MRRLIVKIKTALTCGTDLKAFRRGHPKIPMPGPFGHEFSGYISEVGEGVAKFKVGDPIMSVHSAPCGDCYYCKRDLENLCDSVMETKILGAYAEYIKVPAHIVNKNMFVKPEHLSYSEAAILEPLSCVVYGMDQVKVRDDDTILIIGAGAIGLMHIMVAKSLGVDRVIVVGKRKHRINLARQLGADEVIDAEQENAFEVVRDLTHGIGANIVAECTGRTSVWEDSIRLVSKGGTVILFGGCPGGTSVSFDTGRLHYDQITLKGIFHFTPKAVRKTYDLLVNRKIDVRELITGEYPLAKLNKVFKLLSEGNCIKYAMVPSDGSK